MNTSITYLPLAALLFAACASVPRRAPRPNSDFCPTPSALGCYERAAGMEEYPLDPTTRVMVPFEKHPRKYQGVDILCRERGEPVSVVADGVVDFKGRYMVRVRHETPVGTRRSVYTHIAVDGDIKKGAAIEAGDIVGACDTIGVPRPQRFPRGVLHFEWQKLQQNRHRDYYLRINPLNGRKRKESFPDS